jgi:hypothetical protein
MKSTVVGADGSVRCPACGAVNSFTSKRTGKAKLLGVATIGVGAVAMPKRLKCNGCGANLKRGGPPKPASVAAVGQTPYKMPNRSGQWRCVKHDHLPGKKHETCPIDGSAVTHRPKGT